MYEGTQNRFDNNIDNNNRSKIVTRFIQHNNIIRYNNNSIM